MIGFPKMENNLSQQMDSILQHKVLDMVYQRGQFWDHFFS